MPTEITREITHRQSTLARQFDSEAAEQRAVVRTPRRGRRDGTPTVVPPAAPPEPETSTLTLLALATASLDLCRTGEHDGNSLVYGITPSGQRAALASISVESSQ